MNAAVQSYLEETETAFHAQNALGEPEQKYLAFFSAFVSNYYSNCGYVPMSPAAVAWTFGSPQDVLTAYQCSMAEEKEREWQLIQDSKQIIRGAITALIVMSIALVLSLFLITTGIQQRRDTYIPPVYSADEAPAPEAAEAAAE